jgi:hypothetical protein
VNGTIQELKMEGFQTKITNQQLTLLNWDSMKSICLLRWSCPEHVQIISLPCLQSSSWMKIFFTLLHKLEERDRKFTAVCVLLHKERVMKIPNKSV